MTKKRRLRSISFRKTFNTWTKSSIPKPLLTLSSQTLPLQTAICLALTIPIMTMETAWPVCSKKATLVKMKRISNLIISCLTQWIAAHSTKRTIKASQSGKLETISCSNISHSRSNKAQLTVWGSRMWGISGLQRGRSRCTQIGATSLRSLTLRLSLREITKVREWQEGVHRK